MSAAILCVDDEELVRLSLKEQLRRNFGETHRIEVTDSAESALEIFEELKAEGIELPVVIADQIMPGMKGDQLLVVLHERDPKMKKILLTGQASADAVGNAVNKADLYCYIQKPWLHDEFVLNIREAIRSYTQDKRLDEQNEELRELNLELHRKIDTFFRFVPREFLQLLGVDEAYDSVRLGMGVDIDMAVLFSDIRQFTTMCEGISPSECVKFINDYLTCIAEPISAHGGFIEGFEGDGIMALFSGSVCGASDDAVAAGVGMARALEHLNRARKSGGLAPIEVGIGANAGRLTLGTIGGPGRLHCGVAGDPVNLAARIESLTKTYAVRMLVADSVVRALKEPGAFTFRLVDKVRVKGRSGVVELFEVIDAESAPIADAKRNSLARYDAAIEHYYERDFTSAGRLFAEWLVQHPTDNVALTFLARCRTYGIDGIDEDWTGTESMNHK